MPIVYRSQLGRPLTYGEMDGNFADLAGRTDAAWMMDGVEPTIEPGVGNPAELKPFLGGINAYAYAPGSLSESYANWDVPFNWKADTDLYLALHYSPGASSAMGDIRWGLEFTWAPVNGTFSNPTSTQYIVAPCSGTPYLHCQTVSAPFPGSLAQANMRFLIRIFRDGFSGPDTFPDDAFLVGVDFYYQVDKFGLPSFTPPYP